MQPSAMASVDGSNEESSGGQVIEMIKKITPPIKQRRLKLKIALSSVVLFLIMVLSLTNVLY